MPDLFPYQVEGVQWLAQNSHALLADEMGLGKSAQAIVAADTLTLLPILVLCPASARQNWRNEFTKFSSRPLSTHAVFGSGALPTADVVVCSYDLVEHVKHQQPRILILDESHFLKSRDAKRSEAAWSLALLADVVWCLSGTPAPNHAGELWSTLRALGATDLAWNSFMLRYTTGRNTPYGYQVTGNARVSELKTILAKYCLRRKKEDVMKELPPISYYDVPVSQRPQDIDWEVYYPDYYFPQKRIDVLMDEAKKEQSVLENTVAATGTGAASLSALLALQDKLPKYRRYCGLTKVPDAADMIIDEFNGGLEKIVLFAVHRDVIEELRKRLTKYKPVILYGGTPGIKREHAVRKFQTDPKCQVFIGQVHAAGTAITLTAAHEVMFVETDWVPGNNAQAAMRCHRIGQTKPVRVRFITAANTIDHKITLIVKRKTKDLTEILG